MSGAAAFEILAVSEKPEEEEKWCREDPCAPRPRRRSHIQRMDRENSGDESGAPTFAGEPVENKKQHGVNGVQENVVEMVPAGGRFKKLAVAHM